MPSSVNTSENFEINRFANYQFYYLKEQIIGRVQEVKSQ